MDELYTFNVQFFLVLKNVQPINCITQSMKYKVISLTPLDDIVKLKTNRFNFVRD